MKINLDTNNIQSLVSASPSRIRLPYNWQNAHDTDQEKILWAVHDITTKNGVKLEEIADIKVYALLTANNFRIGGGLQIEIMTANGKTLVERVAATIDPEQVSVTLSKYFKAGASGLEDDYRFYFDRQHYEYMQKQSSRKSSMMLRLLENGCSVDQVLAFAAHN